MSKADFLIKRNKIVDKLESVRKEYEEFLNDVSPKHWRSGGTFNADLKEMFIKIQSFEEITDAEKEIDWVKKALK
jgi:hypothetical protein